MTEEKMLERVRRLLDKAAHPNTPPAEADLAQAKALELAEKYAIDLAVFEHATITATDVAVKEFFVDAPYAQEKSALLGVIAANSSGRSVRYPRDYSYGARGRVLFKYGKGADVAVYAMPSDLERIELLYTLLQLHATRDMLKSMPQPGEDAGAHRRSFLLGFISAVDQRMWQMKQQAERDAANDTGTSTALVLRNREDLVDEVFEKAVGKTTKAGKMSFSGSGYNAGYQSGQSADLGQQKVGA